MQRDFYLRVLREIQPAGNSFNYLCNMSYTFHNYWTCFGPNRYFQQSIKTDARKFLQLTNNTNHFVGAGLLFSTINGGKKKYAISPTLAPIRIAFIEWASNPDNEQYLDNHANNQ